MTQAMEADAAVVPLAHQRRHHQRADLCFKVRFSVLDDDEAMQTLDRIQSGGAPLQGGAESSEESYMENVSSGGLGLCGQLGTFHNGSIKEGDFLKIEIQPRRADSSMRCLGRVAWVEINRDSNIFRAGVSFVAVNPEDLEKMRPNL